MIYRQLPVDGGRDLEYLRDEVVDFRDDNGVRLVDIAHTLGKYISLAVKDCVPGAHQLHKWLVEVASLQMKHKRRPRATPNGLVVESYSNWRAREVYRLQVAGKLLKIDVADTTKTTVDKRRSVSQLSADFVHSQDAAFIQRFIWHWGRGWVTRSSPCMTASAHTRQRWAAAAIELSAAASTAKTTKMW